MLVDLYTKCVLTIIAMSLSLIALKLSFVSSPAVAQLGAACGRISNPCFVDSTERGMDVNVRR